MNSPRSAHRSDVLLRVGMVVTAIGLLFIVISFIPLVFSDVHLPSAMWFLSMLTGVGLLIIVIGLAMAPKRTHR